MDYFSYNAQQLEREEARRRGHLQERVDFAAELAPPPSGMIVEEDHASTTVIERVREQIYAMLGKR